MSLSKMNLLSYSLLLSSVVAFALALSSAPAEAEPKAATRYFELRTYTAAEGKMEALNERFRNHTNQYFKKHGMEMIGYWVQSEGPEAGRKLIYILAYPSQAARADAWKSLLGDAAFMQGLKDSEVNGKLLDKVESVMMTSTDYSAIH